MSLPPTVVPNPRQDLLVTAGDGRPLRQTTYTGRLQFGAPAMRGTAMSHMEFSGGFYLPDSLPYVGPSLASAQLSTEVWVASASQYLFVPVAEARLVADPNDPARCWIQLSLVVQGYSGCALGYRVTASAPPDAVPPPA